MKLRKSLYSILQYISTIDDIFAYSNNGHFIAKDKVGSGFIDVEVPEYFFKSTVVIKSLSKFLRLFSYDRKSKDQDPESIQNWTLETSYAQGTNTEIKDMFLRSPGRTIKIKEGSQIFLEKRAKDNSMRVDNITLEDSIKFQITSTEYKQIISDCSLLDLDRITIVSEDDKHIKIYLTKSGKGTNDDYSSLDIECTHIHTDTKISFLLNAFSLIDATDHQFEFGKYKTQYGNTIVILKVKSFCDNNYVVNKVILADKGV